MKLNYKVVRTEKILFRIDIQVLYPYASSQFRLLVRVIIKKYRLFLFEAGNELCMNKLEREIGCICTFRFIGLR